MRSDADIAVVGAGAAGLMAAIQAARAAPARRVVLLDSQARLGAKILISGGGRCNVTHHEVGADAFHGASRAAIRKVLKGFDVPETIRFFEALGVDLKREETGKLFPVSNRARTVLDALLTAATRAGVELRHPARVETIERNEAGFRLAGPGHTLRAERVILATGGRSVVQTGSDGHGYEMARHLGHTVTRTFPALVPLCLPEAHPLTALRGVSVPARLTVAHPSGKRVADVEGSVLFTHFGLSGPGILDVSRHWLAAIHTDPDIRLTACWVPDSDRARVEAELVACSGPVVDALCTRLPRRVAETVLELAGLDPAIVGARLPREGRRALLRALFAMPLPITAHRGWRFAEVTAGGVPLSELVLPWMRSRRVPGLFLCGEVLDVDGRIGGFNFQWAWASGTLAGRAAAAEHG